MARALQCPDCGNRHPLDGVAHLRTFRCEQCRRLLKVPASVAPGKGRGEAPSAPSKAADRNEGDETKVSAAVTNGKGTRIPPSQRTGVVIDQARQPPPRPADEVVPVPRVVRAAIWLAALPIGLVPVIVLGRITGLLSVDRAVDVFVGVGFGRFIPLLLTAIPWALTTATIAHFAIEGMGRLRQTWERPAAD